MTTLKLDHVSLTFNIIGSGSRSLRSLIGNLVTGKTNDNIPVKVEALKDISIDLKDGERLALIGANGAGKSTLLRIMAGIYKPDAGDVSRRGSITTMFDLSLGMDDEATGLENIYLASALLGTAKNELPALVEDVTEFCELGDAIHRPLRTYSSGMRVRLAFGIVSSFQSDILLIDEIIGVGDARFIQKATARITEQAKKSQIFVLASHSEAVLNGFCNLGAVLQNGTLMFYGPVQEAIDFYNEN